ncbi:MAG: uridyltransferase [Homavirus sp.]|uniref:UDP-N-acetylglucosamine diphosphorylase n=1 Tax=Homavirus sp. TaxID=2487769 RepID=A0A3G5A4L6_9VIRU|nr:MAG: uridyltransferase [Homavirus sp.]
MHIIVLAGGQGKRMKSSLPKVLHLVNDKPMLLMIIEQVRNFNPSKIIVVVGKYYEIIKSTLLKYTKLDDITFVFQEPALGTGHAVLCTLNELEPTNDNITLNELEPNCVNIILNGDTPLIQYTTIKDIYDVFVKNNCSLQITCTELDNPTNNGRIIISDKGQFEKIVEEKDCTDKERNINLVNCGIYIATTNILKKYIPQITNMNAQKEYYLTDLVEIYKKTNNNVGLYTLPKDKQVEITNVNTKEQLDQLNNLIVPVI